METFRSFDSLKQAYGALVEMQRTSSRSDVGTGTAIRDFLRSAVEAGTYISDADERRSAQDMLDYWFTQLLASSYDSMDTVSPRLVDYADEAAAAPASPTAEEGRASAGLDRSRQLIRLGALARQWRLTDKDKGYLLKGEALEEARDYIDDDPDIAAFVVASDRDARKEKNAWIAGLAAVCSLLTVLAGYAFYEAVNSKKAQLAAEQTAIIASQKAEALNRQFADLQRQGDMLDAALDVILGQVRSGHLSRADLPEAIGALIDPELSINIFSDPDIPLNGYDLDFLGAPVSLPVLSEANSALAFEQGRRIDYLNFSLVLNKQRRMAFFTAVNLDRDFLRVLPRTLQSLRAIDPRIPPDAQMSLDWAGGKGIVIGRLASRAAILWGNVFPDNQAMAAEIADRVADVMTNAVPRYERFSRGVWAGLESWTLADHNPLARRVSVFTGPLFSVDDAVIDGQAVPRAFWSVVVSAVPDYQQMLVGGAYAVDVFLIPQVGDGIDEQINVETRFDAALYRISIAELEQMAGLQFPELIRVADQARNAMAPGTAGEVLAARVGELDGADAGGRRSVAQELVTALRDGGLPWAEQRKILVALLATAEDVSMQRLTATGRLNLLFVLSQVSAETWASSGAADLRAAARASVAALEKRAAASETEVGPQTREHLIRLKANLGYDKKFPQKVFLQFTGMTSDQAAALNSQMRELGWAMQDIDEVKPFSVNEVRYNPQSASDRAAAELLAADLTAAGEPATATANRETVAGRLEVWLSG